MKIMNKSTRRALALISTLVLLGMCERRGVSLESGISRVSERAASSVPSGIHKDARVGYARMSSKRGYSERAEAESVPAVVRGMLELSISASLVRRQIRELGSAVEAAGKASSKTNNQKESCDASDGNRQSR